MFPGKSLVCKEKAIKTADKEEEAENMGSKPKADPVYFISLVGVDSKGKVEDDEHIFDIYTKEYDFNNSDVEVKNAQDLWDFYKKQNSGSSKQYVDIYQLVENFVKHHPQTHFVLDECPFLKPKGKCKISC
jgi:hypothetical protein